MKIENPITDTSLEFQDYRSKCTRSTGHPNPQEFFKCRNVFKMYKKTVNFKIFSLF